MALKVLYIQKMTVFMGTTDDKPLDLGMILGI